MGVQSHADKYLSNSTRRPSPRDQSRLNLGIPNAVMDANAFLPSSQQASRPTYQFSTPVGHLWSKAKILDGI